MRQSIAASAIIMKLSTTILLLASTAIALQNCEAFVPQNTIATGSNAQRLQSTELFAVGALVKKAKEAELRQYIADGIEDDVMEVYNKMKEQAESVDLLASSNGKGPLQEALHRRKGTISVIAEYKRKLSNSAIIKQEIFDPELMSPEFREYGASGIAVMADERMGGCTYDDLKVFCEEQRRAKMEVPGPVGVINNDLIIDELQIARSAAYGASAVVLNMQLLGAETVEKFMKCAQAVDLESVVQVSTKDEAQEAVNIGARMITVANVPGVDDKVSVIDGLEVADDRTITFIANILHKDNKGLEEIEEAWACRDKGFSSVWVSDALYKSGNDINEHPGAIIKSMKAKSSLKWASPKAYSGRGEGAREYLGDILM